MDRYLCVPVITNFPESEGCGKACHLLKAENNENNAKTRQTDSQAENISVSQSFPFGRGRYKDGQFLPSYLY